MSGLPTPQSLLTDTDVKFAFRALSFQAQNQAKAAYKNGYPLSNNEIQWILLIRPYWSPKTFGPFSESEFMVCVHKVSESADFEETTNVLAAIEGAYNWEKLLHPQMS
jgi:hypothetical protein